MNRAFAAVGTLALCLGLSSCKLSHGPGGVAYSTDDARSVGVTSGAAGGAVSGGTGADELEKEKRGNTPPGLDRQGHGPADGAIIDPTGAATRGKPY